MMSRIAMDGSDKQCTHHKGCNQRRQEEGWLTAFMVIGQYIHFGYGQWPQGTDIEYIKRKMAHSATRTRKPVFLCNGGDWRNPVLCVLMPHARKARAEQIVNLINRSKTVCKANEIGRPMDKLKDMMQGIDLSKCIRSA